METELNPQTSLSAEKINQRVKIFGVGTAGITIARQMAAMPEFAAANFAAVDADASAPAVFAEQIPLETKVLRGLGTGGDPERGRKLAEALAEAGRLVPVIDATYPLEAVRDATERMERGAQFGKIVLTLNADEM